MINAADFLKWLEVFNVKSGGGSASGTVNPGLINEIAYYAAEGDAVSGLATANNGLFVTSATGVPSIGNTIGASLNVSATTNGVLRYLIDNASNGATAESQLRMENDVSGGGIRLLGSGYSAIPSYTNRLLVYGDAGTTGGILIRTTSAAGGIQLTADNSINNPNLFVGADGNTSMDGLLTVTSGINFGDETLSDYDEGTFTPKFTFATPGDLSVAYANQFGRYTRTGDEVTISYRMIFTPTFTTSSGNATLLGVPVSATTGSFYSGVLRFTTGAFGWGASATQITFAASSANIFIAGHQNAGASAFVTAAEFTSGVSYNIQFSMTYGV